MDPRATIDEPAVGVTAFLRIDAACDRFEDECRAGREPDLDAHLAGVPDEARAPLLRNLLNLDLEYRRRRGERPEARAYRDRFPGLADVVDSVFRSLTDPPDDDGFSDPANPDGLTRPGEPHGPGPTDDPRGGIGRADLAGLKAAGYEVRRMLGRGGMGVVYEARQIALHRPVAIKLLRSGSFATDTEILRFRNEAEAVALLDHPHVVPIYEVGAVDGRPFFSMKLVDGASLDHRVAESAEDPRAAARMVAVVAEAIHHAHTRGILHRDLKPANILIDAKGEPHVTDFGLARRIDGDSDLTHSNTLIGTPAYMAPEQTCRSLGPISTATDVYGLGTILYALLAGRAPFTGTTLVETLDRVRTQYPEPPSRLNPRVPRDLEVICRKCLEKEPGRRYPSALALSEDLYRWLRNEPIVARPVGRPARAAMWCRRNPVLAATAAIAIIGVLAGFAGVTWKWRVAVGERERAEVVIDLLTDQLLARVDAENDPWGRNPKIRDVVVDFAGTLGGSLDSHPDVQARLRKTIGAAYLSLGDYPQAEDHLRRAIALDRRANGPGGRVALDATNRLATLLDRTARSAEAERILRRNLADCRSSLGRDDPATLDAAERLGTALWHLGRLDEAEAVLRRSVADRGRVLKPDHAETLRSVYLLSRLLRERGRLDEAGELAYRYAHDVQCALSANHPDMIRALTNQGDVARDRRDRDAAALYYRHAAVEAARIFGPGHPKTREAEANLERFVAGNPGPSRGTGRRGAEEGRP